MRFNRLAVLRQIHNLTQADLAEIIGVSQQAVQSWESGTRNPPLDRIIALGDYFNVSIDYLLGRSDTSSITIIDTKKGPSPEERAQTVAEAAAALAGQTDQSVFTDEEIKWLKQYVDSAIDRALDKRGIPSDDPAGSPDQNGQ